MTDTENIQNVLFVFLLFVFFLCIFYAIMCMCKCRRRSQYNTPSYIKEKYATARLEVAQSTGLSGMPTNITQSASLDSIGGRRRIRNGDEIEDGDEDEEPDYEREILDGID